jgi:hypothetical protein
VIGMGTRGINFNLIDQAGLFYQALKNTLGSRRTAYIAHTDKQYLNHPIPPRSFLIII